MGAIAPDRIVSIILTCFVQRLNQKVVLIRSPQAPLIKGGMKGGIKKNGGQGA